ncbi:hypothetical protein [Parashewanella tropica]|uniref:hypothetical protein n=1 Tax=Parashewanella tropica TaxID=2547970 RepID=UPI001059553D|nr:hypothetical protein [Parashewanella tropica]
MGFSPFFSSALLSQRGLKWLYGCDEEVELPEASSSSFFYKFASNTASSASSLALTTGVYTLVMAPTIGLAAAMAEHHSAYLGIPESKAKLGTQAVLTLLSNYSLSNQGLAIGKALLSTLVTHSTQEKVNNLAQSVGEEKDSTINLAINTTASPLLGYLLGSLI